jgi:hypothetical protein
LVESFSKRAIPVTACGKPERRNRSPPYAAQVHPAREKEANTEDLSRAIREAIGAEIAELANDLAFIDDAHLFGPNQLRRR